ncbi:MAG: MarR family winged helix-turn-helix transcriptional regulator [Mycobacteriales bacterium]
MSPRPSGVPIGLQLSRTARAASRAFDAALTQAGGSLPTWLVLLAVRTRDAASQRELAAEVGIQGATLTHHLNAMEDDGLLTRRRDPANRRVHLVELTKAGEAMFDRLRTVAVAHDRRLRAGLHDNEIEVVRGVLSRMLTNLGEHVEPATKA